MIPKNLIITRTVQINGEWKHPNDEVELNPKTQGDLTQMLLQSRKAVPAKIDDEDPSADEYRAELALAKTRKPKGAKATSPATGK